MNEEKKESPDEFSLHKSVEADEIIEFYKDKEFETEDNEIEFVSEKKTIFDNIINWAIDRLIWEYSIWFTINCHTAHWISHKISYNNV